MKYEQLKLGNQLCFPLYATSKEIVRRYKPFLDEIDLTYTQYIVMMVLWEEGKVTVKELGDRLYLDSGTLTPLLKYLVKKGYVKKTRSKKDERLVYISLTEKGENLQDIASKIPEKIGKCFNITIEEAGFLYQVLHKILNQQTNN